MKLYAVLGLLVVCVGHVICDLKTQYNHHATLDESNKFQLYWTVEKDVVNFAVEVETTGWVGLGISTGTGKMDKADVIMGWVKDGKGFIQDRFAGGYYLPDLDEQQDVTLTAFKEEGGKTTLEFNRKTVTCDGKDHPINEGTVRLIWSYCSSDPESETSGFQKHSAKGSKSIMILNSYKGDSSLPNDTITYNFVYDQVSVPSESTTYWCGTFKVPESKVKKHVVMIEPVVQSGNEGIIHHMVLYVCKANLNTSYVNISNACHHDNMPDDVHKCKRTILFAWAIGAGNFSFPENAGFPLGEDDSPKILLLEIHYDNPDKRSDIVDSSGIRFHVTSFIRQYDADFFYSGVSLIWSSMVIPPKQQDFLLTGHCIKECTSQTIPEEGMHVFAIMPHTHLAGYSIRVRQVRDGVELLPLIVDDNYDFNFQEYQYLNKEVTIKPGDELITECRYNTMSRNLATQGGESTQEEMCYAFMLYYPRNRNLGSCISGDAAIMKISQEHFYNETGKYYTSKWSELSPWKDEYTTELRNGYENPDDRITVSCRGVNGSVPGLKFYQNWKPKIKIDQEYPRKEICTEDTVSSTPGAPMRSAWMVLVCACSIFALM